MIMIQHWQIVYMFHKYCSLAFRTIYIYLLTYLTLDQNTIVISNHSDWVSGV